MRINPTGSPNHFGLSLNRGGANSSNSDMPPADVVVSLVKGQSVSLTKDIPNLDRIHVGLGWDVNQNGGPAFDLDVSVFMVNENEKVPSSSYFIFYNQLQSPEGSVIHTGDNLTGHGDGDDESIKVELSKVPEFVKKLVFTCTIHEAHLRKQNFGQVNNAFIRIVDENTGREILRYNLTEKFRDETALIVGEIYRHNGEWCFNAVGNGYNATLADFCAKYGVRVG